MLKVFREHFPTFLASMDIAGGIAPLHVSHPQTLQVPMSENHDPSTVSDTVTDCDIPVTALSSMRG